LSAIVKLPRSRADAYAYIKGGDRETAGSEIG
jgi:hypothetical protein